MYILIQVFPQLGFNVLIGGKKLYNLHKLYSIFTFNI